MRVSVSLAPPPLWANLHGISVHVLFLSYSRHHSASHASCQFRTLTVIIFTAVAVFVVLTFGVNDEVSVLIFPGSSNVHQSYNKCLCSIRVTQRSKSLNAMQTFLYHNCLVKIARPTTITSKANRLTVPTKDTWKSQCKSLLFEHLCPRRKAEHYSTGNNENQDFITSIHNIQYARFHNLSQSMGIFQIFGF